MARTKQSARGAAMGKKRVTFPKDKKSKSKRKKAAALPKLQLDLAPSDEGPSPSSSWEDLEATIPGGSSPIVEAALDKVNALCPTVGPPQDTTSIAELVESLSDNPTDTRASSPVFTLRSPPPSPFSEGMIEDLPVNPAPSTSTIQSETITQEPLVPLQGQARGVAVRAPRKHPASAKKCPRPEHLKLAPPAEKPAAPRTWKNLTALREIKRLQREYKPVLPLAPFARAVRGVLHSFGPYRLTRQALEALRCATEQYGLDTLQAANLLTRHRDRATLLPKDIMMVRRVRGENETIGITQEVAGGH